MFVSLSLLYHNCYLLGSMSWGSGMLKVAGETFAAELYLHLGAKLAAELMVQLKPKFAAEMLTFPGVNYTSKVRAGGVGVVAIVVMMMVMVVVVVVVMMVQGWEVWQMQLSLQFCGLCMPFVPSGLWIVAQCNSYLQLDGIP